MIICRYCGNEIELVVGTSTLRTNPVKSIAYQRVDGSREQCKNAVGAPSIHDPGPEGPRFVVIGPTGSGKSSSPRAPRRARGRTEKEPVSGD